MSWEEAQYTIDEVLEGMQIKQISGIPPKNMKNFSVLSGNGQITVKCTPPDDTIIENQLVCTVKGVRIIRKLASIPKDPNDGVIIGEVLVGDSFDYVDTGLTNGLIYYYGFFPFSDHGIFNHNPANVLSAKPYQFKFWAFDQNFADLDPTTTISYPSGFFQNTNFSAMMTNEGNGTVTAGGWLPFLQNTLKNYPYMVRNTGIVDYALNPNDYTKKKVGGAASDYNNDNYDGGAFAWINKIWMHEEYSSDGESREVQWSDGPEDGFLPVGFYDMNEEELNGVWIPMGYMNYNGKTLIAGSTPGTNRSTSWAKTQIDKSGERAVFFAGPIMNVLRDLLYMLFKTTDIQKTAGLGRSGLTGDAIIANNVVPNGSVQGWKGTNTKILNKYFHSQVLGSYQSNLRDPYWLLNMGVFQFSPFYKYDLTGNDYENTNIPSNVGNGWTYPTHLIKGPDLWGSLPKHVDTALGSTSIGLCDGVYKAATLERNYTALRWGGMEGNLNNGPSCVHLAWQAEEVNAAICTAMMLLPPPNYTPN